MTNTNRDKIKEIMLKWRSGEIVSIETAVDAVLASVQQSEPSEPNTWDIEGAAV